MEACSPQEAFEKVADGEANENLGDWSSNDPEEEEFHIIKMDGEEYEGDEHE